MVREVRRLTDKSDVGQSANSVPSVVVVMPFEKEVFI